ncbi:Sialin [Hypsibius exemplaris]|uniref:Sialin n=1 Tax=Hypsibius exemplaris TaxID=2072580 RepID=A0A1W0WLG5_HYPEX|nr:Sialin [Hypsibius exemplaris]
MPLFGLIGHRYVITIMGFFGNFFSYCMRLTVNMALVQMVQHPPSNTTSNTTDTCPGTLEVDTAHVTGDFDWTSDVEGNVLGSFYYGYLVSQIPAGFLAAHISAKTLFACGIGATGLFTLLSPVAARHSSGSLIGIRVLQGLAQGVCFPLLPAIFGRWAPPQERTKMLAINSAGVQAGTVFAYNICGVLGAAFGWESMFYCFGSLGLIFVVPWMLLVHDSPEHHPSISGEEKSYIISSIGAPAMGSRASKVPWRQVLKSRPYWALIIVCWASDWGFYTLLSDLPLYLRDNLHYKLKDNSGMSSVPYAMMLLVVLSLCPLGDFVIKKGHISVTNFRKMTTILGSILPGLALIGIPYVRCDRGAVIALLALAIGLTGIASLGFRVNFNDISPSHAGLLYAIANTCSTTTGFIGPIVTGILTTGDLTHTIKAWQGVFIIAAVLYFFAALIYGLLASGELQNWESKPSRVVPAEMEVLQAAGIDTKAQRRRSSIPPWIPPSSAVITVVPESSSKQFALLQQDKPV